jgi:hypothetical protein
MARCHSLLTNEKWGLLCFAAGLPCGGKLLSCDISVPELRFASGTNNVSELVLLFYSSQPLPGLPAVVFPSLQGERGWLGATNCLCCLFDLASFSVIYLLFYISPCDFLYFSVLYVVCSLLSKFLFMQPDAGSIYSSAILLPSTEDYFHCFTEGLYAQRFIGLPQVTAIEVSRVLI